MLMEIVLGLVVAIIIYNLIHHFVVVQGSKKYQLHFRKITDQVVKQIIADINHDDQFSKVRMNNSSVLSDVWGREILVFEYEFNMKSFSDHDIKIFASRFKDLLINYCKNRKIMYKGRPKIVVTDTWSYHRVLRLDVACLSNDSTLEYIDDLKRLQ